MEQKQLYNELSAEVKKTGKLYLVQRKQLWKAFGDESALSVLSPKEKEIRLAWKSITKVAGIWKGKEAFLSNIKSGVEHINVIMNDTVDVKEWKDSIQILM